LLKALHDCTIVAPFDGWVAERWVSSGERMVAMFPGAGRAVTLLRINPLRLSLTVSQQHVTKVRPGAPVVFQTDAFPGRSFRGRVRYIAPAVTSDSRSLVVEAEVPNPDHELRPGMFVTADLELAETRNDLFIPRAAVHTKGEVAAVFIVRGGVAREQIVALGEPSGDVIQVTSGLGAGDVIVTEPAKVRDGDRVGS
jgi:RND family efflux transporter MFP subunit